MRFLKAAGSEEWAHWWARPQGTSMFPGHLQCLSGQPFSAGDSMMHHFDFQSVGWKWHRLFGIQNHGFVEKEPGNQVMWCRAITSWMAVWEAPISPALLPSWGSFVVSPWYLSFVKCSFAMCFPAKRLIDSYLNLMMSPVPSHQPSLPPCPLL